MLLPLVKEELLALDKKRAELVEMLNDYEIIIGEGVDKDESKQENFVSPALPNIKQYIYDNASDILIKSGHVLDTEEFLNKVLIEFNLPFDQKIKNTVSGALSYLKFYKRLANFPKAVKKNGRTEYWWGLPKWADGKDNIKEEFKVK